MTSTRRSHRITTLEEIAEGLREALLGGGEGFLDRLYAAEEIEDPDLRPLVAGARAESARFLRMAREKLKPAACQVLSAERQGTSVVVKLLLDDAKQLEVLVDDLYEREGELRTRDVMRLKLTSSG